MIILVQYRILSIQVHYLLYLDNTPEAWLNVGRSKGWLATATWPDTAGLCWFTKRMSTFSKHVVDRNRVVRFTCFIKDQS